MTENDCAECQKFSKVFIRIQDSIAESWGDPTKHDWVLNTFVPGAINVLTKIAKHCQHCVDKFEIREKSMKNLNLHFVDWAQEKRDKERHYQILSRCHQVLARLEGCRHYGKEKFKYYSACVKAIKEA